MATPTPGQPLADIAAAFSDPLFQMIAHLGVAPRFGTLDTLQLSDLTEATFPGYAPVPVTPTMNDGIDEPGYGEADQFPCEWVASADASPQYITCVYVTKQYNGANASLVCVAFLPEAIQVDTAGDTINYLVNVAALGILT